MQLVGLAIKHNAFGNGVVTDFSGNIVTVCFAQGDKRFLYPDAFSNFLTLKDKVVQNEINVILNKRLQEEIAQKQKLQKEQERRHRIRTLKITPNSQAAFNLDSKDIDETFLSGTVSTGRFVSGPSKGEPRIPSRLRPNSACLLTECPINIPEKERLIIGAFMVSDDFLGDLCGDGLIKSHDQHIIRLNSDHRLRFWDYFDPSEPDPRWGSTAFKYFPSSTMQQILLDMREKLDGTENDSAIQAFYQYFCEINRLPEIKNGD